MISLPAPIPNKIQDAMTGDRVHAFLSDGLQDVVFNVLTDQSEIDSNEVTQHAIEDGSPVSDHVIGKPKQLTLNIVLSDEDITFINPPTSQADIFLFMTIGQRKKILNDWNDTKELLSYYSYDEDYDDIVIESITRGFTTEYGSGLHLTLTLKQLTIVDSLVASPYKATQMTQKGSTALGQDKGSGLQSQAFQNLHGQ